MKRPSPELLAPAVLAALLVVGSLGCGGSWPAAPECDGAAVPGVVSLWPECDDHPASVASVPVVLTNGGTETIWYYHECGDEVPWPSKLQADGTWLRLLPPTFFLTTGCEMVMELAPGQSVELAMSTQRAQGVGTYRAEMVVAVGCVGLHEPLHVPHFCTRQDFIVSAPFDLR